MAFLQKEIKKQLNTGITHYFMKTTLFLFFLVLTNILTGQAITPIAAKPTDTVKVYTPTLMFDKDTVLPTINIFSKKENTESIILIIVSGDTLADPLSKMVAGNAHGSMYAYVGKNHIYNNYCYVLVDVQMHIFKKNVYS